MKRWSDAFNSGLDEMFRPRGGQHQRMGGMFTGMDNEEEGKLDWQFTPQTLAKNRLMNSGPGMAYKFLKGFMI